MLMKILLVLSLILLIITKTETKINIDPYAKPIEILIMGPTGVGKSSLINFLMNKEVAPTSDDKTGTNNVNMYETEFYGFDFRIYDSPGLFDYGNENTDDEIIKMIVSRGPQLNILLLCYDLSAPRIRREDNELKNTVVDAFGSKILNYVLIVYTKANLIDEAKVKNLVDERHTKMGLSDLPFVIAYDDDNYNGWKSAMWNTMLDVSKKTNFGIFDIVTASIRMVQNKMNQALKTKKEEEDIIRQKIMEEQRTLDQNLKIQKEISYMMQRNADNEYSKSTNIYNQEQKRNECFDINSDVYVMTNNIITKQKIKNINIGDNVKTNIGYSKVYFTYEHDTEEKMLHFKTFNDNIKITENHIMIIKRNDTIIYIKAKDVLVGDFIETSLLGKYYWSQIKSIGTAYGMTKYLLTEDDTIVVNDIVVSCHVDNHWMGHYLTYVLRIVNHCCPLCLKQDRNPLIEGLRYMYSFFGFGVKILW